MSDNVLEIVQEKETDLVEVGDIPNSILDFDYSEEHSTTEIKTDSVSGVEEIVINRNIDVSIINNTEIKEVIVFEGKQGIAGPPGPIMPAGSFEWNSTNW